MPAAAAAGIWPNCFDRCGSAPWRQAWLLYREAVSLIGELQQAAAVFGNL